MKRSRFPVTLSVARKDCKILLKDRGTLIYLFVLPLLFILAFGGAAGVESTPEEKAIVLPVVNLDAGSEASQTLLDALEQGGGIQKELYEEAEAKALLDRGKITLLLTIPANYGVDLASGQPVTLYLVNGPTRTSPRARPCIAWSPALPRIYRSSPS